MFLQPPKATKQAKCFSQSENVSLVKLCFSRITKRIKSVSLKKIMIKIYNILFLGKEFETFFNIERFYKRGDFRDYYSRS